LGRRRIKTTVVAYADYVTIFVTSQTDFPKIQETLHCYEEASGAKINIGKPRAIAIGPWDTSVRIMDIPYHIEAKILGLHVTSKVQESDHKNWTITTAQISAQAQDVY